MLRLAASRLAQTGRGRGLGDFKRCGIVGVEVHTSYKLRCLGDPWPGLGSCHLPPLQHGPELISEIRSTQNCAVLCTENPTGFPFLQISFGNKESKTETRGGRKTALELETFRASLPGTGGFSKILPKCQILEDWTTFPVLRRFFFFRGETNPLQPWWKRS